MTTPTPTTPATEAAVITTGQVADILRRTGLVTDPGRGGSTTTPS